MEREKMFWVFGGGDWDNVKPLIIYNITLPSYSRWLITTSPLGLLIDPPDSPLAVIVSAVSIYLHLAQLYLSLSK